MPVVAYSVGTGEPLLAEYLLVGVDSRHLPGGSGSVKQLAITVPAACPS